MSGLDEPATVIWFSTPEPDTELGRPCNSASFDTLREAVLFVMRMSGEERESAMIRRWKGIGLSGHRSDGQKGKSAEQITAKRAISQIDGCRANAMMRGRPCPLQRGHCTSRSARSFSVAWLHAQVQVNHGAAAITGDNQPVML
jgi:hypothetical protein